MAKKKKKNKTKIVLALGDTHCGHRTGLLPPGHLKRWRTKDKWERIRREQWKWFAKKIEGLGGVDIALWLGDMTDGDGSRSGGVELLTTDMIEQVDMFNEVVGFVNADKNVLVTGTPYHVSLSGRESAEDVAVLSGRIDKVGSHEWVDVNGTIFDIKHKIGGSGIPHGRSTAISRERLWNVMWNEREMAPKSDVLLRGHVHYFGGAFGVNWLGMTLPSLQGLGTKYGSEQCSGVVDFGFVVFTVQPDGETTWKPHIAKLAAQKAQALIL